MLLAQTDGDRLDRAVDEVAQAVRRPGRAVRTLVDARYVGQSHETTVEWSIGDGWPSLIDRFHSEHQVRNGFARPGDPVEVVTVRAEATGTPAVRWEDLPRWSPDGDPRRGERAVITATSGAPATVDAMVWWRPSLPTKAEVTGPAVIEEHGVDHLGRPGRAGEGPRAASLEVAW